MKGEYRLRIPWSYHVSENQTIRIFNASVGFLIKFGFLIFFLQTGVLTQAQESVEKKIPLDSLLHVNSYELILENDHIRGSGFEMLVDAVRQAQFFAIAEEHNLAELNKLTSVLFQRLHHKYGFNYIALEQGSVITSWLGSSNRRGNYKTSTELIRQYPHALTFATDEELKMIVDVGRISSGKIKSYKHHNFAFR